MTNIKQPKYILFDVGNVLVYKVTHEDENIAKLLGKRREEYRKLLDTMIEEQTEEEHRYFKEINTIGKEKEYLDNLHIKICKRLGIKAETSLISQMTNCRMKGDFALKEGVLESLTKLSEKYHLGIFTNSLPSRRYHELRIMELYRFFDHIFISKEIGFEKPDPEGYEFVLKKIGYRKDEVMFVDDKTDYLEGAEKVGLHNLVMIKNKDYTTKYLIVNNLKELVQLLNS